MTATRPLADRFWGKVHLEPNTGCWLWAGSQSANGYGTIWNSSGERYAHRVSYVLHVGAVPEGKVLDHTCRQRCCVNPDHLRPLDERINVAIGKGPTAVNARKTHCNKGHALTPDNLARWARNNGRRQCKKCLYATNKRYRDRRQNADT